MIENILREFKPRCFSRKSLMTSIRLIPWMIQIVN